MIGPQFPAIHDAMDAVDDLAQFNGSDREARAKMAIAALLDLIETTEDALEAVKTFLDANENQLAWETANSAIAKLHERLPA